MSRNHIPASASFPVPDGGSHHQCTTTPHPISAHSSFRAFSEEEVEEIPPIRPHSTPAWPDVTFSPANAGLGSHPVSIKPVSDVGADTIKSRTTTQGRRAHDRFTPSKPKRDTRAERTRRGKSKPTSQHRPFTPQTPTSITAQGITLPSPRWPFGGSQQPTSSTQICKPSLPLGRSAAHVFNPDVEMADVDIVADSHASSTIPKQNTGATSFGISNTFPGSHNCSPQPPSSEHPSRMPGSNSASDLPTCVGPSLIILCAPDPPNSPHDWAEHNL